MLASWAVATQSLQLSDFFHAKTASGRLPARS